MNRLAACLGITSLFALAVTTNGQVIVTGNEIKFYGSLVHPELIDFAGYTSVYYTTTEMDAGIDYGYFTLRTGTQHVVRPGDITVNEERLELVINNHQQGTPTMVITLDRPAIAFGATFEQVGTLGIPVTINGVTRNTRQAFTGNGFAGFVSNTPFTQVTLGPGSDKFLVDTIRFSVVGDRGRPVPEVGSMAMMIAAPLGFLRRRRR
jgi:hypothetical protein